MGSQYKLRDLLVNSCDSDVLMTNEDTSQGNRRREYDVRWICNEYEHVR